MDQAKQDFVNSKRIAVVGVSRTDTKFGNATYRELKKRGYDVVPVHPSMESFDGDSCYQNIQSISPKVDGVFINVTPSKAADIIKDAEEAGVKNVWLQQGSQSEESINLAKSLGLNLAAGGCILMYAEPVVSIHGFHRWLWKLIGKY